MADDPGRDALAAFDFRRALNLPSDHFVSQAAYTLCGDNEGDNERHWIVRRAFFNAFIQDDRVAALWSHWAHETGVAEHLPRLLHALTEMARLAGFPGPQAALTAMIRGDQVDVPDESTAERLWALGDEAEASLRQMTDGVIAKRHYVQEALALVREMRLPWLWLAWELYRHFCIRVERALEAAVPFDMASGEMEDEGWELVPAPELMVRAPAPELHRRATVGEPLNAALQRLQEGFLRARRELLMSVEAGDSLPKGARPGKHRRALERDAVWYYRLEVKKEKVTVIARDHYGPEEAFARRKDVREGVRRAGELLDLIAWKFRPEWLDPVESL